MLSGHAHVATDAHCLGWRVLSLEFAGTAVSLAFRSEPICADAVAPKSLLVQHSASLKSDGARRRRKR